MFSWSEPRLWIPLCVVGCYVSFMIGRLTVQPRVVYESRAANELSAIQLPAPMDRYQQYFPVRLPLGTYVYVDHELMQVAGIWENSSMVIRGVYGTEAQAHSSGSLLIFPASLPRTTASSPAGKN